MKDPRPFLRKQFYKYAPRTRYFDGKVHMMRFMQATKGTPSTGLSYRDKIFRKLTGPIMDDPFVRTTTDREHVKTFIDGLLKRPAALATYSILRTEEDIAHADFPRDAWVRTTHSYVIPMIVREQPVIPRDTLKDWLATDYYHRFRERNYKGLTPGILVEPYFKDGARPTILVALCYKGEVSLLHTHGTDPQTGVSTRRYYSPNWEDLNFSIWDPVTPNALPKPETLDAFLDDCATISTPFEIVGVEALLYPDGSYAFFALSHCPDGGLAKVIPTEANDEFNARFFRKPPYGDTEEVT